MAHRGIEIRQDGSAGARAGFRRSACHRRAGHDGLAVLVAKGVYRAVLPLMRLVLAVAFARVRVLHGERLPREGGVLLVANHPSTWTDVVLLDAALGRGFHFLAQEEQFRPWPRGILLRLYGALPLSSREHRPDALARNEATFLRCEELFDRGEGVAVFPEGISRVDRGFLPLKHGAARLALSYAARRESGGPFALVPVGIHYSDRTAFRSRVTISVGPAIPAAEWGVPGAGDPEEQASRLTERMAEAMHGLVLELADRRLATLFSVLEPIAADRAGSLELEHARLLARALVDSRRSHPADLARLERRARAFDRMRRALGVSQGALGERSRVDRAEDLLALLAGALPALAGLAIHALPAALTQAATGRYASEPSRVAFARIASGFLFFSLFYGAGGALLVARTGLHPAWLLVLVPLSGLLGLFAQGYTRRVRLERERWRLARISRRHGRFVRRARRERETLRAQMLRS
jgi:1-acyl-sn-glycerol-3-phosphate acyltransferase